MSSNSRLDGLKLIFLQKALKEPPYKFVSTEIEVQLACRLLFVDMEGLSNSRAVKSIVPRVNPRKMVSIRFMVAHMWLKRIHLDSRAREFGFDRCSCRCLQQDSIDDQGHLHSNPG